jgi:hypothetical protein
MDEQNCLPWSEVTSSGMLNLDTQPDTRVSAQLAAEVDQSLGPGGRPIDDGEEMSVAVLRRGEGAYQIDVQVAETLGGVGDVSQRQRRLGRHLTPLAVAALTVSAPGGHLRRQAGPHETAGDQPSGRPDARVRQAVHGVEDGTAKNLWNDGSEDT